MADIIKGLHGCTPPEYYVPTTDPEVLEKLEAFKDMKLGYMAHWGLFSELGMMESWALTDQFDSECWSQEEVDWVEDIAEFKEPVLGMNRSFNPVRLNPKRYAESIASIGFKYAIMPTKHHEGFCIWDTDYSEFKTTSPDCPFSTHKYADIFGSVTKEFQKLGLTTGAYFSKADWHCDDYWPAEYKKSDNVDSNVGYDVNEYPEKWEKFVQFTQNQMLEIVTKYDPIEIMWLDAGQVNENNNQDIRIAEIVEKMREVSPGLIVCDRCAGSEFENYITPEQSVPVDYIDIPWESCLTLGNNWGWLYDDKYKTVEEVVSLFVAVLCKGGNMLLNVGPQPNGELPKRALMILDQFGTWVKQNSEAIFETRPVAPYFVDGDGVVADKQGQKYLYVKPDGKFTTQRYVYSTLKIDFTSATYLGEEVKVENICGKYRLTMPTSAVDHPQPPYYVFAIN